MPVSTGTPILSGVVAHPLAAERDGEYRPTHEPHRTPVRLP